MLWDKFCFHSHTLTLFSPCSAMRAPGSAFLAEGVNESTKKTRSRISEFSGNVYLAYGGGLWRVFPSKTMFSA